MYQHRQFEGPPTYVDEGFMEMIHRATGLADFPGTAIVVDVLMSKPEKVALGLREISPQHRYFALDTSEGLLTEAAGNGMETLQMDIKKLGVKLNLADVAVARYGLKDVPKEQQASAMRGISMLLKPDGVLVIADMVSPDGMKFRTNQQHSLKQELGGRNIQEDGRCNIPTFDGWINLLEGAGFVVERMWDYVSHVATTDWVNQDQITIEQRRAMDELLSHEPRWVKYAFRIRGRSPVKIDFPVSVIRAVKPVESLRSRFPAIDMEIAV